MKHIARSLAIGLLCVVLTTAFFAPHLWVFASRAPESFEWQRGLTYLAQCEHPLRQEGIEAAMQWRLLPPLVAHALGLRGVSAFLIPWLGAVALAAYVASLLARALPDRRFVIGGTLLLTTTSACLVPIGWLGINDAWAWLGLLCVAFAESPSALLASALLCPWVDERFLIGLPLAWLVRSSALRDGRLAWRDLLWLLALLPYVFLRLRGGGNLVGNPTERGFLRYHLLVQFMQIAPLAPFAWWMGLRAASAPLVYGVATLPAPRRRLVAATALGTGILCVALAADMSRSIAILVPLVVFGVLRFARNRPDLASRAAVWAGVAALLLPAAHVVHLKIAPIDNLAVELLRWHRLHP